AGGRAAAGHAVAAGIVDDDEVDAARLLALGRQPGAGAAADDRDAAPHQVLELREDRGALDALAHVVLAPGGRDLAEVLNQRLREGRIVDVEGKPDQPAVRGRVEIAGDRLEQRVIRRLVVKRLAGRIHRRDALLGKEETDRPFAGVELASDESADLS